ncbi:hypothetical protein FRX31_031625, partial [Thalictrum thalictroides]
MIFQNIQVHHETVARNIDHIVDKHHIQNLTEICRSQHPSAASIWLPPQIGNIKINVDISFCNADSLISIGYIFINSNGKFIFAGIEHSTTGSAEEAKCRGLLAAVKRGVCQQLKHVEIDSDNKGAVDYLQGKPSNLSWTATNFLDEASTIAANYFTYFSFMHCNRSGNQSAHILASRAH